MTPMDRSFLKAFAGNVEDIAGMLSREVSKLDIASPYETAIIRNHINTAIWQIERKLKNMREALEQDFPWD